MGQAVTLRGLAARPAYDRMHSKYVDVVLVLVVLRCKHSYDVAR